MEKVNPNCILWKFILYFLQKIFVFAEKPLGERETFQSGPSFFFPKADQRLRSIVIYSINRLIDLNHVSSTVGNCNFFHLFLMWHLSSSLKPLPFCEPSQLFYIFEFIRTAERAQMRSRDLHNGKNMSWHIFWVIWITVCMWTSSEQSTSAAVSFCSCRTTNPTTEQMNMLKVGNISKWLHVCGFSSIKLKKNNSWRSS